MKNEIDRLAPIPYITPRSSAAAQRTMWRLNTLNSSQKFGEVSEWLKEHAWKVCIRQRIEGSNPSLTAKYNPLNFNGFFHF